MLHISSCLSQTCSDSLNFSLFFFCLFCLFLHLICCAHLGGFQLFSHSYSLSPEFPCGPCVPPRPYKTHAHVHMVLITSGVQWREWVREGETVKEKHRGSPLPVSFTTEPWLSSQESVPPVAQQTGNNGMRQRRMRVELPSLSLPLSAAETGGSEDTL